MGGVFLIGIFIQFLIPVAVASATVTAFIIAHRNRKCYICEECGETYKVKQMSAKRCSVCGTELVEVRNKDLKKIRTHFGQDN